MKAYDELLSKEDIFKIDSKLLLEWYRCNPLYILDNERIILMNMAGNIVYYRIVEENLQFLRTISLFDFMKRSLRLRVIEKDKILNILIGTLRWNEKGTLIKDLLNNGACDVDWKDKAVETSNAKYSNIIKNSINKTFIHIKTGNKYIVVGGSNIDCEKPDFIPNVLYTPINVEMEFPYSRPAHLFFQKFKEA